MKDTPSTLKSHWYILVVDDDEDDFVTTRSILTSLKQIAVELAWARNIQDGYQHLQSGLYDVALIDYFLGADRGLELVQSAIEAQVQTPLILLSGQGSYEMDMEAMQSGAFYFLDKNELTRQTLERTIRYAIERKEIEQELRRREDKLRLLAELSKDFIAAGLNYRVVLDTVANRISETFQDAVMIRILDPEDKQVESVAAYRPHLAAEAQLKELLSQDDHLVFEDGILREVERTRQPKALRWSQVGEDRELQGHRLYPWLAQNRVESILVIPLQVQNKLLGIMGLMRSMGRPPYDQQDQDYFQDLADRASLSIENAKLHEEVQRLAVTDSLTNLLNRRGFFGFAEREFERSRRLGRPISLVMMDIDHFKDVNDRYGHALGDQVLRSLAGNCMSHVRKIDLLGRYGGDEFIILFPDTRASRAKAIAERMRQCFESEQFDLESGETVSFTASFGVSQANEHTANLHDLISHADMGLYASKQKGRNRIEVNVEK
jgi:diguanylate cyclase (GGDEF)-like protein